MKKRPPCLALRKLARIVARTSQRQVAKATRVAQPSICTYLSETAQPNEKTKRRFVKLGIKIENWEQP